MPEMPLKLHTLLVGHSIKRKWIQKFKEARHLRYICQNQSDKACFPHDMFSPWKTAPQKLLRDKAFNIAKSPKYVECQRRFASMIYIFLIKIKELAEELHKPIIKKFQKGKGRSRISVFIMCYWYW